MGKRVLITNWAMAHRGGTELYVRDLAAGLLQRGHRPMVWSPILGDLADEFRLAGIPIFDSLDPEIPEPDVIHCHHHDETLAALSRFPERPGLYVLHDAQSWHDNPPIHPRLLRYLAVDEICRERLVVNGVDRWRTSVVPNSVDLGRFRRRDALPGRPKRALAFGNAGAEDTFLPTLREACDRSGVHLDVVGAGVGAVSNRPEELLGQYDVVFAKARAALEALAVGAAVVVVDLAGVAGMVTSDRIAEWRRWNFGRALLTRTRDVGLLCEEIASYDPDDAAKCTDFVRANCSTDGMVESLLGEYDGVEKQWIADEAETDHAAELRAVSRNLARVGPLRVREDVLQAEIAALDSAVTELRSTVHRINAEYGQAAAERDAQRAAAERAESKLAQSRERRMALRKRNDEISGQLRDIHHSRYWRMRAAVAEGPVGRLSRRIRRSGR